jgi:hypothetical protein
MVLLSINSVEWGLNYETCVNLHIESNRLLREFAHQSRFVEVVNIKAVNFAGILKEVGVATLLEAAYEGVLPPWIGLSARPCTPIQILFELRRGSNDFGNLQTHSLLSAMIPH